jgi:hypothetical protein
MAPAPGDACSRRSARRRRLEQSAQPLRRSTSDSAFLRANTANGAPGVCTPKPFRMSMSSVQPQQSGVQVRNLPQRCGRIRAPLSITSSVSVRFQWRSRTNDRATRPRRTPAPARQSGHSPIGESGVRTWPARVPCRYTVMPLHPSSKALRYTFVTWSTVASAGRLIVFETALSA